MMTRPHPIVLALLVAVSAGCGEKREPPPLLDLDQPRADSATRDPVVSQVPMEPPPAADAPALPAVEDAKSKLPENLWPDVPLPEGGSVVQALDRGTQGFTLIMTSDDTLAAVLAKARDDLKAEGWRLDRTVALEQRAMITCSKDKKRLQVLITGAGGTRITWVGDPLD